MNSRLAKPIVGCFVIVEDDSHLGIGKLVGLNETKASVEWFESVSNRHVQEYNPESLRRVFPSKQTRCYVSEDELSWKMGRIMGRDTSKGVTGIEYDIHWPKKQAAYVPEEKVFVRCDLPSNDPMETLIHRAHETAFFHDRRSAFLSSLVKQRAIGHGLTGLLSSRIRLYPYQIQIIHRVLEDPVQRYLLADEVGLGKTIEAGVILRQTWLDNQDSRALVIVPPTLELQWLSELEDKLGLDADNGFITLVTTDQISQLGIKEKYDIVVIDEAQHVASSHRSDDTSLWDTCRVLAHDAPKLLLLSATPALHHEEDFLAILHLLEPQNYRLEDIDTFRVRVRNRQPIGRLIQRLHGDVHVAPLRRTLDRFRELFPKDELVLGQVKALEEHCNAEKFDQVKVRELIQDLMIHICETHRIYRRMLRTSRSSLPANTLCPRTINPGDVHVTKEWGFDERLESVLPLLEEWRATAVASVWKIEEGKRDAYIEKLTDVFIVLLQSSSNWLQLLAWAIKCRLSGVGKLAQYEQNLEPGIARILVNVPLFNGEENLLRTMLEKMTLDPEDGDQIDILVDYISNYMGKAKCVVFTSNTVVGKEIIERLGKKVRPEKIVSYLQCDNKEDLHRGSQTFSVNEVPMILVCDEIGEEGLNLQFADMLIQFDLPWDPIRLEQRIGRLDRIGRVDEVRSRVFVADNDVLRLHETWYRILNEGFCIFTRSIADLQFLIDIEMPKLKRIALLEGACGLDNYLETLKEKVEKDRRLLGEQAELDMIQAMDRSEMDFLEHLISGDKESDNIQEVTEEWILEALLLRRRGKYEAESDANRYGDYSEELIRYIPTPQTLIPIDWALRIKQSQDEFACYSRKKALDVPGTSILRIGHPFFDIMREYLDWDDRGKAFAIWRLLPKSKTDRIDAYFRLNYVIEAELNPVEELLKTTGWEGLSKHALSYQADAWYPPSSHCLYVDLDMKILGDPIIEEVLNKRYLSVDNGGLDYNLNVERQWVLEQYDIVSPDRWEELCNRIRDASENTIRRDIKFEQRYQECVRLAERDLELRMARLRHGLLFHWGQDDNGILSKIDSVVEKERLLFKAVISGIERPRVRLDAVGLIVLAGFNPFANVK